MWLLILIPSSLICNGNSSRKKNIYFREAHVKIFFAGVSCWNPCSPCNGQSVKNRLTIIYYIYFYIIYIYMYIIYIYNIIYKIYIYIQYIYTYIYIYIYIYITVYLSSRNSENQYFWSYLSLEKHIVGDSNFTIFPCETVLLYVAGKKSVAVLTCATIPGDSREQTFKLHERQR